jgi:cytochrome c oxidase subunit 1
MSQPLPVRGDAEAHPPLGFWRNYVFSEDHKMIGKQFLWLSLFMLLIGGGLAVLVRYSLAWPGEAIPHATWLPSTLVEVYEGQAYMGENAYNAAFTMHATIMVFFVIMPLLIGAFGNFLIPLMIGARDMAFPFLNMLSFWVAVVAGILMLAGFYVPGGHAAAGWTAYVPLSADPQWTGVDWGQNLWCISLLVLGISSLMGSINYITTIINMRAPGMTLFRMPLVVWALFITAILLLLALPVLTAGVGMLMFDRMAGTAFFHPSKGGQVLLWQHLFWFFGHPECPVHVLPQADLRLSRDGLLDHLDRFPRLYRVGASHVPERHEPMAGDVVYGHHDGHCGAVRHQDVQLAWDAMAGIDPLHHADAQRHRLRGDVRHRWAERHLHGFNDGGHLHP